MEEVKIIEKEWGTEEVFVNNNLYCLKRLTIKPGYRCSWHWHLRKDETFVVTEGKGFIEVERYVQGKMTPHPQPVEPGSIVRIPPHTFHRFYSHDGMVMWEVSTHHDDSDVTRKDTSGPIEGQGVE